MTEPEPSTDRVRRRFAHTQRVGAAPEDVFPLLCPVRESEWIPEWECELVYTASGVAEEGCVFRTHREADGGTDTWVVSRHEPPRHVAFVRVNPLRAIRYDVRLTPEGPGTTRLLWEQEITALDEEGDHHVAALREEDFEAMIDTLQGLLERHLAARS